MCVGLRVRDVCEEIIVDNKKRVCKLDTFRRNLAAATLTFRQYVSK